MYECEHEEQFDGFAWKVEKMIDSEVNRRLSDRIKQAEKDTEYHREQMWKTKQELVKATLTLKNIEKETDKKLKEAAKTAQREYWFDCAIGDYVYLIDYKYHSKNCERCGSKGRPGRIQVLVDGIEVDADCPVCGTYEKSKILSWREPYIAGGKVVRLQIEMIETHKWIKIWLDRDEEHKLDLEYQKVFRTKEEAEAELKDITDRNNR